MVTYHKKLFFFFFSKKMSNCAHVIDISVVKKGALNTFRVTTQVHLATLAVVKSEESVEFCQLSSSGS